MSPTFRAAAVGLLGAGDHAQQGGLAGAVAADHAHDAGPGQAEGQVVDQHAVAVGLAHAFGLHHEVAEALPGRDVDLHLVELGVALLGQEGVVAGEAGLVLGQPRRGAHPHPLELAGQRALAGGLLLLLLGQPRLLLLEPGRVVALERDAAAAVELEDPAGDVVEEVAVVGHGHHGARVLVQVALEPAHRIRVEVVGGLVEQQQVGLGEQQPAQGHATALAPAQVPDGRVARRAAQGVHGRVHQRVEVPGVGGVDLLLQRRELVRGLLGVVGGQLVEAVEHVAQRADPVLHVAANVLGLVQLGLLLEQPHGGPVGEVRLPAELGVDAGHDPQQSGLAGAVGAQHADLRPGVEGEGDVGEHLLVGRVHPGEALHGEDELGHGRPRLAGGAQQLIRGRVVVAQRLGVPGQPPHGEAVEGPRPACTGCPPCGAAAGPRPTGPGSAPPGRAGRPPGRRGTHRSSVAASARNSESGPRSITFSA